MVVLASAVLPTLTYSCSHCKHVAACVLLQVVIDLAEPEAGNTILTLTHTGLPEEDKFGHSDVQQQVEEGWKRQVFSNIKAIFGYGA